MQQVRWLCSPRTRELSTGSVIGESGVWLGPGRYADGGNLYLHVRPGGSRQWVFFFRWQGKLREMSLGGYPGFSLKEAREKAAAARALAKAGVDPLTARREAKIKETSAKPFGQFAIELVDSIESGFKNVKHRWQWRQTLTAYCQPIWDEPIDRVSFAARPPRSAMEPTAQERPSPAQRPLRLWSAWPALTGASRRQSINGTLTLGCSTLPQAPSTSKRGACARTAPKTT
jgi:Arm DNA-binding domain